MDRRTFLRLATAGVATTLVPTFATAGQAGAGNRPNVLFIAIDDLNDWIGCLGGHPDAKTPNLDRLASRGVLFTNAHCSAPACNPSRASLMTGILPSTSGVYHNPHPWRKSPVLKNAVLIVVIPSPVPAVFVTVPALLNVPPLMSAFVWI